MDIKGIAILAMAAASWSAEIPRTPEGKPDLSGIYDIATLTPLVRPARFGDRLMLNDEEARAIAKEAAAFAADKNKASSPDRAAPPQGGDGSEGPYGNVGGY